MATLAQEFDKALLAAYQRAKTEARYTSQPFFNMLTTHGGVTTAMRLINLSQPSQGYTTLYERGRLDLTVEAVVVDEARWHPLFPLDIINRARKRLQEYGYKFCQQAPATYAPQTPKVEKAWTQAEVDACVEAYLEMLDLEIAGAPYSKIAFNRRVQAATGRSKGSIEFKFGNVSAVMDWLGFRWIQGYKPAPNAQTGAIRDAVMRLLGTQAQLAARLEVPAPSGSPAAVPVTGSKVFADAPPRSAPSGAKPQLPSGCNVKKFDRALTDARNRDLGRAGEEFVLKVEKARLAEAGRKDLADKVCWVADEQGDGAGYDIASFSVDGSQRLIEVKTTNGSASTSFLITANEVEVSRANPDTYWLYRIYDFAKEPRIYCEKGPLDDGWDLEPAVYRAKR
ncbi:DUF3883 domain-containing protein [Roseomonas sp. GCM10028921]